MKAAMTTEASDNKRDGMERRMGSSRFCERSLLRPRDRRHRVCPLLARTVRSLGHRADTVEALARGHVQHALAGTCERRIGRLARKLDGAEILPPRIEHLHPVQARH